MQTERLFSQRGLPKRWLHDLSQRRVAGKGTPIPLVCHLTGSRSFLHSSAEKGLKLPGAWCLRCEPASTLTWETPWGTCHVVKGTGHVLRNRPFCGMFGLIPRWICGRSTDLEQQDLALALLMTEVLFCRAECKVGPMLPREAFQGGCWQSELHLQPQKRANSANRRGGVYFVLHRALCFKQNLVWRV